MNPASLVAVVWLILVITSLADHQFIRAGVYIVLFAVFFILSRLTSR